MAVRLARWAAFVAVLAFAVALVGGKVQRDLSLPGEQAVDLLPMWLGARAMRDGLDPGDADVLAMEFDAADLRVRVGGFFNY